MTYLRIEPGDPVMEQKLREEIARLRAVPIPREKIIFLQIQNPKLSFWARIKALFRRRVSMAQPKVVIRALTADELSKRSLEH